jgi:hypothetical protein
MTDPLEGRVPDLDFLQKCADKVRTKYEPKFLILSEDDFRGLVWAMTIHHYDHVKPKLKGMGIEKVVWAGDLPDGEFMLSSGKGLEEGIETVVL